MRSHFESSVSDLYWEWEDCLMESLNPMDRTYFDSICFMTATEADLTMSLFKLTYFLARKFGRRVLVLIDEYESPIIWAFDHGYFNKVRSLCSSL